MRNLLRHRGGQSMVEFAVLAPIFFLLLLGTIDLGRAVYIYNSISDAAREGARAAVPYDSPLPTTAIVVGSVQSKLGGGFSLSVDPCSGQPQTGSCPATPTTPNTGLIWYSSGIGQVTGHHPVVVKVTFLFQPWVPVVRDASGNGVTMSAESTMETEY
jgi:Flp pilus assembly protein TadG